MDIAGVGVGLTATSNDELVAEVRLPLDAVSVYPVPARFILRSVKVATPFTAGTVAVPKRLAPAAPVPDVMLTVTESVADVTVFPSESVITTTGWVVNVLQATAPDGCVEKARVVGPLGRWANPYPQTLFGTFPLGNALALR